MPAAQPARARTRSRPRSTPSTATRPPPRHTDWGQIVALYDQLLAITPTPVVALNRAVAVAEIDGPQVALALVDELRSSTTTCSTRSAPISSDASATRTEAEAAYRAAIERTDNAAEIAFMNERISAIRGVTPQEHH